MAFDENPEAFLDKWSFPERILSEQIVKARAALNEVRTPAAMLTLAVRLSTTVGVQGHRSDIIILKAARALAAMLEKAAVEKEQVAEAARYALLHRMTTEPLATPEKLQEKLEEAVSQAVGEETPPTAPVGGDAPLDCWYEVSTQVPGHVAASSTDMIFSFLEEKKKLYSTPMN
jgi:Mg-chelatase subunit ChlI